MPLGVIPKNEMHVEEMVSTLEILHNYVPYKVTKEDDKVFGPIAVAGDQLTVARYRTSQEIRVSSTSTEQALRGLTFFAGDWHAKVNFMEVSSSLA